MQQSVQKVNVDNLPKVGYYVSKEQKKEKIYRTEPHIHKQGPLSGVKAEAHKLYNDVLAYFPKGFAGSKNSDFYEYLSLGKIPYLIGSALLIGLYCAANKNYNSQSASAAGNVAKKMGMGVVLYGIGKWLSKTISHKLIKASTGVDLDYRYLNKVNELPETGQEKGMTRIQYPGVFDSADFPRKDLIAQDNELNYENIYAYEDKIAKKAGFKDKLNAPNQTIWPKIRELKVRTTALENISKYIMAATGVALGSQKAFEGLKTGGKIPFIERVLNSEELKKYQELNKTKNFQNIYTNTKTITKGAKRSLGQKIQKIGTRLIESSKESGKESFLQKLISKNAQEGVFETIKEAGREIYKHVPGKKIFNIFKDAFKQLWQGNDRNILTKHFGKALIIASAVSTLITWLVPTIYFKKNPSTIKSKVDTKKEYEVC